jgi:hypothetical protein
MNERFVVGCVTGWPITAGSIASGRNVTLRPRSVWYVWDRAYCYEIVGEFRSAKLKGGRKGETISGEKQARACAARLNAEQQGEAA